MKSGLAVPAFFSFSSFSPTPAAYSTLASSTFSSLHSQPNKPKLS
jgi:hypothetical protein